MSLPKSATVAIVGLCSDPRFSRCPEQRVIQLRNALDVDYVVMLMRPGIVRLFSDSKPPSEESTLELCQNLTHHVFSFLDDFMTHVRFHSPCIAGLASHATCGGFKGTDEFQKATVISAARNLERVLSDEHKVNLKVAPLFEERIRDDDWIVHNLLNGHPVYAPDNGEFGLPVFHHVDSW